jgi:hypothetical protein
MAETANEAYRIEKVDGNALGHPEITKGLVLLHPELLTLELLTTLLSTPGLMTSYHEGFSHSGRDVEEICVQENKGKWDVTGWDMFYTVSIMLPFIAKKGVDGYGAALGAYRTPFENPTASEPVFPTM